MRYKGITTVRKEPFIAPKDLIVYKELELTKEGNLITPDRNLEMVPGKPWRSSPKTKKIESTIGEDYKIDGEGTLASPVCKYSHRGWKAIIPKGTRFWVDNQIGMVTSEVIIPTKELACHKDCVDLGTILDVVLEGAPEGVGKVIPGQGITLGKHPVTGELIMTGLECHRNVSTAWSGVDIPGLPGYQTQTAAGRDYEGRANTKILQDAGADIVKGLPEGAWIPGLGELRDMLTVNALYVNAALLKLGESRGFMYYYWSSTKGPDSKVWGSGVGVLQSPVLCFERNMSIGGQVWFSVAE